MTPEDLSDGIRMLRQIHPAFINEAKLDTRAYKPNEGDNGEVSCDRDDMKTPAEAWHDYTAVRKNRSAGTQAVTVEEVKSVAGLSKIEGLSAKWTPIRDQPSESENNEAHSSIVYPVMSKSDLRKVTSALRDLSAARGWLHRPTEPESVEESEPPT